MRLEERVRERASVLAIVGAHLDVLEEGDRHRDLHRHRDDVRGDPEIAHRVE